VVLSHSEDLILEEYKWQNVLISLIFVNN